MGLDPAPFRLRAGGGLDRDESEPILDRVIEACRNLVLHGVLDRVNRIDRIKKVAGEQ